MAFTSLLASIGYIEIFVAIIIIFVSLVHTNKNGLPRNYPFLGMFPAIAQNFHRGHEKVSEILSKTGGTLLIKGPWFANMDILLTVDPANVHYIMSANFRNFPKGPEFKKIFDVFGDGLFTSDMWKDQRKLAGEMIIHERFHKCVMRSCWDKVENGLIRVLEFVAKGGVVVDLEDVFKRLSFDTTCKLVMGFDPGCLSLEFPDIPFMKIMDDANYVGFIRHILPESVWKLQKWVGMGPEMRLRNAEEVIDQFVVKYISMRRDELSKGENTILEDEDGSDLLTSYILLLNDGETKTRLKFDEKFLRDTTLSFILAGSDTVGACLTWFIWLVFTHPEVAKNIREQLKAIIPAGEGERQRLFTADELKNVVYLHAALCESMRLYPPVPFQRKSPQEPDILPSGHRVHPKMRVIISMYAMGRMESIWGKDALEFKPERWISEHGTVKCEPSYKFFAFNAGPRTCLGKEVAFTQMKLVVAAIIHNYQIELVKGHVVYPNCSIILHMKHGLKVRVKKRWA